MLIEDVICHLFFFFEQVYNVSTSNNPEMRDDVLASLESFVEDLDGAHIDLWKKREMNRRVADMQNKLKKADKLNKKLVIKQVSSISQIMQFYLKKNY